MLVSARPETPEFFPYFNNDNERAKMSIYVRFAGARVKHDTRPESKGDMLLSDLPALPADLDVSLPVAAKSVLQGLQGWELEGIRAYLHFKSEGTVEFASDDGPGDILSKGFWATPPIDADVVIEELGNMNHGWIDVRPTGNVDVRIADGSPDVARTQAGGGEAEKP
jgi:hypothetical protein